MKICFDMDGTIADLYGVENWLNYLITEDTKPYKEAKPMVNMSALARSITQESTKLNAHGYIDILQAFVLTLSRLCHMVTINNFAKILMTFFLTTKKIIEKTGAEKRMM